jgi:hypothetical protein
MSNKSQNPAKTDYRGNTATPAHLYVLIFLFALLIALPSMGTITVSSEDPDYPTKKWEASVQFSGTDAEGKIVTMPGYWGAPTAIDYVQWSADAPFVNGEDIHFLSSEWSYNSTSGMGELSITRTDLDGNDALTSGATCVIGFTWE